MFNTLIIVIGLFVFETVNSIDNAIINAHVLKTMSEKWRKIFLFWGILTAVFILRGVLPFAIVWLTVPELGFSGVFYSLFHRSSEVANLMEARKGIILVGAGMFLVLLYLHWLFLEKKDPFFIPDKLIKPHFGVWFFACAAILLVSVLYLARSSFYLMLAAAIGNAIFFILHGFREQAAKQEEEIQGKNTHLSDFSKLMYLEILDASFSFDGVMGAFAFTTSVPLILIGNGVGALVVRDITIRSVNKVAQYKFLKNGAMTSIGFLGIFILIESLFNIHIPVYLPTFLTIAIIGLTFWKSWLALKNKNS